MTSNEFWAIIDRARRRAAPNSEPAMRDALYAELVQLPALKLSAWQDLQYAYMDLACTRKLFGAAVLINGGSSDDRFLDFTAWLVMQGKTVYESALAAPDSLAQFDLPFDAAECELCGYIADQAYTGKRYLALFAPNTPARQLLRQRYPDRTDIDAQVARICRDEALGRPFYPSGGDQDIKGLLLQWDIAQCMIHSGVSRYNELLIPDWQAHEELRAELAEHLTIQKGPVDSNLKEALPQLWQKRTEWEEAYAVQRPYSHRGWER